MTNRNLVDNEPTVKWTAKASVFTDLFSDVEYTYQLYCALHPADSMTTRDDMVLMTIEVRWCLSPLKNVKKYCKTITGCVPGTGMGM